MQVEENANDGNNAAVVKNSGTAQEQAQPEN